MTRFTFLIMLILLTCCAGCSSETPDEQTTQTDSNAVTVSSDSQLKELAEPVTGGRLTTGTIGDASNLIPALASDSSSHEVANHLYASPLKYDKNLNITTEAAESYEVLDGGKRIRITLKKGILWDDGVELTTDDVEFTYKMMIDPETPTAYAEDYLVVKELNIIDAYTFEAVYDQPFARALITWMHAVMPKHKLQGENLMETAFSRQPLSSGPYRLKEWVPGSRIVLEARDEYFEGRPNLDQIVYRIIPDMATMFLELKADNLDLMGLTPQQYLYQTKGQQWDQNYNKYKYLSFSYLYLGYNLRNPLFQDVKVRQALAYALNKEDIIKGVYLGQAEPTIGPYKPGTWVYNDQIEPYGYDPDKAKALLAEAGWEDTDGDGMLDKDGKPFAFTIMTNQGNEQRSKTAAIIQKKFEQVGIQVDIRVVEWASFIKEFIDKGRFEAIIMGWNITQDPDNYDVWHSSKAVEGGLNFVYYKNPELDELLEKARYTVDQAERKKYYDRVQEILHRDQPYCFLATPYSLPIVQARFHGIDPAPAGISYNMNDWWIPTAQQRYRMQQ